MLKKQNHSVLFLVRVGDDSGLISTFLWLRCSHFLDLESSVCYGMRQASALQALVSGAGCTATQMGCLATAPGTWGGTGQGRNGMRALLAGRELPPCLVGRTWAVLSSHCGLSSWAPGLVVAAPKPAAVIGPSVWSA